MRIHRLSVAIGAGASALALALSLQFGAVLGAGAQSADPMAEAQKAQVMIAIYELDNAGLHGLDERVAGGTVPAGSPGTVRRARIVTQATSWPEPLSETARSLGHELAGLEDALRDEDVDRAKGPGI